MPITAALHEYIQKVFLHFKSYWFKLFNFDLLSNINAFVLENVLICKTSTPIYGLKQEIIHLMALEYFCHISKSGLVVLALKRACRKEFCSSSCCEDRYIVVAKGFLFLWNIFYSIEMLNVPLLKMQFTLLSMFQHRAYLQICNSVVTWGYW